MFKSIIVILTGYIIGSIPTGYLIAKKISNINIREMGSGNIGTTNMTRVMGKRFGALTLLGDGAKALVYMLIIKFLIEPNLVNTADHRQLFVLCTAGLAVLLGNCFSIFLNFNGGKGGVTTYGVFLALAPLSSIVAIFVYIAIGKLIDVSAAGTLSSVIVLPIAIYFIYPNQQIKSYFIILAAAFAIIVWLRHTKNIRDMISEKF